MFDDALTAAASIKPLENQQHTLSLEGVHYADPDHFSLAEQKRAILEGRSLDRRLRGTFVLRDRMTGQDLDRKTTTLARIPYFTPRGTYVQNGTEYTLASQLRLRSGAFARRKQNGELETHVNVLPGSGFAHRVNFDQASGVFQLNVGQAHVPLLSVLRAIGARDDDLREAWGPELFARNARKDDPGAFRKFAARFRAKPGQSPEDAVRDAFAGIQLDGAVNAKTLGTPIDRADPSLYMAITRKLIGINNGSAKPDDRDHLAYMTAHGPEDLIAERIARGRRDLGRVLWKASLIKSLKTVPTEPLSDAVRTAIFSSGLGQPNESVNPSMWLEQAGRISRLGVGAIPSVDAVPDEARAVQPSHLGFIDPLVSPESMRAGVDSRIANNVHKGSDGRLYTLLRDVRTGEPARVAAQDLQDKVLAIPGELQKTRGRIVAMKGGRLRRVGREEVDYELPHMEDAFSPVTNMVPFKSGVKGQRAVMAGRMLTQSLPLLEAEAPFVQSGIPDAPGDSYENRYGVHMGALRSEKPGVVTSVEPGLIRVRHEDGTTTDHELYQHVPNNRKTGFHQTPTVQVGQEVGPGSLLARSNFTDKDGVTALGRNLRVAYLPAEGYNFEDAIAISESAAKKLTSEHYYQHGVDHEDGLHISRDKHVSMFPSKYDRKTLSTIGDDGVVKVGTVVKPKDPLILAVKQREPGPNQLYSGKSRSWSDQTLTWDHPHEGVVTDVVQTKNGPRVVVRSHAEMEVGDKLCYTPDHDVLTDLGWKPVADVTTSDRVASLNPSGEIEYLNPAAIQTYDHDGRMYALDTTQVSLCVTENHNLYAKPRSARNVDFMLIEARDLFGKRYRLKRNGSWQGKSPEFVTLPSMVVSAGQFGHGTRELPPLQIPVRTYAMLLGMYLSEGSKVDQPSSGSYGFDITQIKPESREEMLLALQEAGIDYTEHSSGSKVRIFSKQWLHHLESLGGRCYEKRMPAEVFAWDSDTLLVLYRWLMWGDGSQGGTGHVYHTTSPQLADDVQRLALHVGLSANIDVVPPRKGQIKGKCYDFRACYWVSIFRKKNQPTVNHGHCKQQSGQIETWIDYSGKVHCVTLPRNHVLYVRRKGKPVWCGNSGRYGDKGVIGKIIPDHEMPHDAAGNPYEILVNDLGVITRTNSAQAVEAALGKIVERTGQPYRQADFRGQDLRGFADDELARHGLSSREDLRDPKSGALIRGVLTGSRFFMKLHHMAADKGQGRGLASYTAEGLPAKGGPEGSKRVSLLDSNALLSSGATAVLRDAGAIRGQSQPELWQRFMAGHAMPEPRVPLVYEKFLESLKAAGVNPVRRGPKIHLMALTDRDVEELAGDRNVSSGETMDWKSGETPVTGGLFDPSLTGGPSGRRWSAIPLHEPMPNPAFEEPIRRILGLTKARFEDVLAGDQEFQGISGPTAIRKALDRIDLDGAIAQARAKIASGRGASRDAAIRALGYLKGAKQVGIHPREWMLTRVPVLPPMFRPVSLMAGSNTPLISDPNYLYKDLFEAASNHKAMAGHTSDLGVERRAVYNAMRAVVGLGDPIGAKNQERGVTGILKSIFGAGGPKTGIVQRKLLGAQTDLVGRAVISPDPELDMDSAGIPEDRAWDVYKPFIVRRLVRGGTPHARAVELTTSRDDQARQALLKELEDRPVILTRAPVLHRYGVMAFRPQLVKGSTLRLSPLIVKGFGADFDGDAMNYAPVATDEAITDAIEKLLPSRNLLSASEFKPHMGPSNEFAGGLFQATMARNDQRRARVFATIADAIRAYRSGEIGADHPVEIVNH